MPQKRQRDAPEVAKSTEDSIAEGTIPAYNVSSSEVTGFLIDLDGTIYTARGLIPGAKRFFEWLNATGKQYVFLSNTGAKTSHGVQKKFASKQFKLCDYSLSLRHIYTAAEAQAEFMVHPEKGIPKGSKVLVVAGGERGFWLNLLRTKDPILVDSWDLRTSISLAEAKEWAKLAKKERENNQCTVFLVLFSDGPIGEDALNTSSLDRTAAYHSDWAFELLEKCSILLGNGAQLIYTAPDAFTPSMDPQYPDMVFPIPGTGMFGSMLRAVMYPSYKDNFACAGKGGSHGAEFMMSRGIEMLKQQGHSGDLSKIAMVGDRFDTDIKGAVSVGIKGILVESGTHKAHLQHFYKESPATWVAASVDFLHTMKKEGCPDDANLHTLQSKLSTLEQRSNHFEYFIPGLFALAYFMVVLRGLQKFNIFRKPVQGFLESLMRT